MKTLERVHITKAPINLIVSFARRGLGITPSPFEGFPPSLGINDSPHFIPNLN
jgi:hypothetical protein